MQFRKGMTVRISNDLTRTYKSYGSNDKMEKMKGKNFKIENVLSNNAVKIKSPESSFQFSFKSYDLKPIENMVTEPKPTMSKSIIFDPKELDI